MLKEKQQADKLQAKIPTCIAHFKNQIPVAQGIASLPTLLLTPDSY